MADGLRYCGPVARRDRLRRVAVGQVERIEVETQARARAEVQVLLGANVEHPDVVFAVRVHRLDIGRAAGRQARARRRRHREGAAEVGARLVTNHRRQADAERRVVRTRRLEAPLGPFLVEGQVRVQRVITGREVVHQRVAAAHRSRPLVAVAAVERDLHGLVARELGRRRDDLVHRELRGAWPWACRAA